MSVSQHGLTLEMPVWTDSSESKSAWTDSSDSKLAWTDSSDSKSVWADSSDSKSVWADSKSVWADTRRLCIRNYSHISWKCIWPYKMEWSMTGITMVKITGLKVNR